MPREGWPYGLVGVLRERTVGLETGSLAPQDGAELDRVPQIPQERDIYTSSADAPCCSGYTTEIRLGGRAIGW